jgi:hypothetical protein
LQDKLDVQEKLKLQDKELKDALSQRKLAMAEYTEVTDRFVFCYFEFAVFSHKPQYRNNGYVWMVDEDKCLTE